MDKKLKVINPQIAVYGEWIFGQTNGLRWMKCSECNVAQFVGPLLTYSYCPNCGSKMNVQGYRKTANKIMNEVKKVLLISTKK